MSGVMRGQGSRNPIPARRSASISSASCATPDAVIPHDSACPTVGTYGANPIMKAIEITLNNRYDADAAVNRSSPFSTPETSAARQIRIR